MSGKDLKKAITEPWKNRSEDRRFSYGDLTALSCGDNHVITALGGKEKANVSLTEVFAGHGATTDGRRRTSPHERNQQPLFRFRPRRRARGDRYLLFGHGWRVDAHRVTGEEELYQGCRIFFRDPGYLNVQAA